MGNSRRENENATPAHCSAIASGARNLERTSALHGAWKVCFSECTWTTRPLSENGVRTALRTLGFSNDEMTPHGFRAMARTILDEVLNYKIEWIEQQLAHAVRDANGRAYNRTAHLPQRKEMMQAWADYLDVLRSNAYSSETNQ